MPSALLLFASRRIRGHAYQRKERKTMKYLVVFLVALAAAAQAKDAEPCLQIKKD
jgi:hypothetical protein